MTVPSSYTDSGLKAFMHGEVGEVGTILGWSSSGGSYDEPLIDALFLSDAEDITDVTTVAGVCKLRALARVAVWRQAVKRVAARYDFSADGGSYSRSQLQSMCADALAVAEAAAAPYMTEADDDNTNTIQIYAERPRQDPYSYLAEEDRTL
jgi:hypothetical protein